MTRATANDNRRQFTIADLNTEIDGTPRMKDLTLAEALGFDRPRKIRELIQRHEAALSEFGSLAPRRGKSRGQEFTEYHPNKKQALYICTKSETENATEITIQMVEVFDAYTTDASVHVRSHDRRTSTRLDDAVRLKTNIDRLETITTKLQPTPNFCAMVIDGEHVFVDTGAYDLRDERAVVLTWDGDVKVMIADSRIDGHRFAGERSARGPLMPCRHGHSRSGVVVLGKVIEPDMRPDMRPDRQPVAAKQIEHQRLSLREQIVPLLLAGPYTNLQIARRVGCHTETVRRYRVGLEFEKDQR